MNVRRFKSGVPAKAKEKWPFYLKHVFPSAFACFSHYSEFHQTTARVPVVGRAADQAVLRLFPPHAPEPR